jgi:hypothetical protein
MSVSNREITYFHTHNNFGASGYISDNNWDAEGLLSTADNCEHIEN